MALGYVMDAGSSHGILRVGIKLKPAQSAAALRVNSSRFATRVVHPVGKKREGMI